MRKLLLLPLLLGGCVPKAPDEATITPPPPPVVKDKPARPIEPEGGTEKDADKARLFPLAVLKKTKLTLPKGSVEAYVMDDGAERQEGMMFLGPEDVTPKTAMVFVFPKAAPQRFWMSNTLVPLDIVYISEAGKVVSISRGKPKDETGLPSAAPARYVLEVPAGRAASYGLAPGTKVGGLKNLQSDP